MSRKYGLDEETVKEAIANTDVAVGGRQLYEELFRVQSNFLADLIKDLKGSSTQEAQELIEISKALRKILQFKMEKPVTNGEYMISRIQELTATVVTSFKDMVMEASDDCEEQEEQEGKGKESLL